MVLSHDAIILGGGTGRRLGGASKPEIRLHGQRLLDHVLAATTRAGRVVVVAPESVPVPTGVQRTLEDPPHGGPVAGIAAGLTALETAAASAGTVPAPHVLVLACDVPGAAGAVPRLLAAVDEGRARKSALADGGVGEGGARKSALAGGGVAGDGVGGEVTGVVARDAAGREQWLVGVYRTDVLRARLDELAADGGLHGCPVRVLVRTLALTTVPTSSAETADIDTWADYRAVVSARDNEGQVANDDEKHDS